MTRRIVSLPIALGLLLGTHTAWGDITTAQGKALSIAASTQGSSKKGISALRKLKNAANAGDPVGEFWLGAYYVSKRKTVTAASVYWYRKAAHQGYALGEDQLGSAYYFGNGIAKNYKKAVYWWRKAAAQGNFDGQNGLSLAYSLGRGVPKDRTKAQYWEKKATKTLKAQHQPLRFARPADCPLPSGSPLGSAAASTLNGTWMVNLDATARYIRRQPYLVNRDGIAEGIGYTFLFWTVEVLHIQGETVTFHHGGVEQHTPAIHCTAASSARLLCTIPAPAQRGGLADHFTIAQPRPGQIIVIHKREPSSRYLIWTRAKPIAGQSARAILRACQSVTKRGFQRILAALKGPRLPADRRDPK